MANVVIDRERCKGCELCIPVCPQHLLRRSGRPNSRGYHPAEVVEALASECVGCGQCFLVCPDVAIEIQD